MVISKKQLDMISDPVEHEKAELEIRLLEIQNEFKSTDWMPNKIIRGEWNQENKEWQKYLVRCAELREEQDRINERINHLNILSKGRD